MRGFIFFPLSLFKNYGRWDRDKENVFIEMLEQRGMRIQSRTTYTHSVGTRYTTDKGEFYVIISPTHIQVSDCSHNIMRGMRKMRKILYTEALEEFNEEWENKS